MSACAVIRPRAVIALLLAAAASLATSESFESFIVEGEASWTGELGGAAPARRRFEVRVSHPELDPRAGLRGELIAGADDAALVVLRAERPEGRIAESPGRLSLELELGAAKVVEIELLDGATPSLVLEVRARYLEEHAYQDGEAPPAPSWTAAPLTVTLTEIDPGPEGLDAALPPRAPGALDLHRRHGACGPFDPLASAAGLPRLDVRGVRAQGPIRPGAMIEVVGSGLDEVFALSVDGLSVSLSGRSEPGVVRFLMPPVGGPVQVVLRGTSGAVGVLPELIEVAPSEARLATSWPSGRWRAASLGLGGTWLVGADGEVGVLGSRGGFEAQWLPPETEVRDLRYAAGAVWLATSRGLFLASQGWLTRAVDGDLRAVRAAGERGVLAAGATGLLFAEAQLAGFHAQARQLDARDANVAPCEVDDWVVLTDEAELRRSTDAGLTWTGVGRLPAEARWIARAPQDEARVFAATPDGRSFVHRLGSRTTVDGPPIQRFALGDQGRLYGAGPTGLWWWNRGSWRRVATWPEDQVIGLLASGRAVRVYTARGELDSTPQP